MIPELQAVRKELKLGLASDQLDGEMRARVECAIWILDTLPDSVQLDPLLPALTLLLGLTAEASPELRGRIVRGMRDVARELVSQYPELMVDLLADLAERVDTLTATRH